MSNTIRLADALTLVASGPSDWPARYAADGPAEIVRIGDLTHGTIRVDDTARARVVPPTRRNRRHTTLAADDVLVSIISDIGKIGHLSQTPSRETFLTQNLALLRPDPARLDGRFLAHALAAPEAQRRLAALAGKGGHDNLSLANLRRLDLPIPTLSRQRAIAEILDDWEAALARTDALGAALDLRRATVRQRLVENLQTHPRRPLSSLVRARQGRSMPPSEAPGARPVIGASAMLGRIDTWTSSDGILVGEHDVVLLDAGSNAGRSATGLEGLAGQTVRVLTPTPEIDPGYLQAHLAADEPLLRHLSRRSGQPRLPSQILDIHHVAVPPLGEQRRVAALLADMTAEINALAQTRKRLATQHASVRARLLAVCDQVPLTDLETAA